MHEPNTGNMIDPNAADPDPQPAVIGSESWVDPDPHTPPAQWTFAGTHDRACWFGFAEGTEPCLLIGGHDGPHRRYDGSELGPADSVLHRHGQSDWHVHTADDYATHQQPIDNEERRS
jgi:hypothetical protein